MVEQVMIAPITHNLRVNVPVERAFEIFTAGFSSWWPPEHHIGEEPFATIVVEPQAGGRWFERDAAGTECNWGRVLTWDPPHRLVLAWQLGPDWRFDPDISKASEIEVRFAPEGERATQVEFEHRGFERRGEGGASIRDSVSGDAGWTYCLAHYAEAANAT